MDGLPFFASESTSESPEAHLAELPTSAKLYWWQSPVREVVITSDPHPISPSSALVEESWEESSSSSSPSPSAPTDLSIGSHALPETANDTRKQAVRGVDSGSEGHDEARLDSRAQVQELGAPLPPPLTFSASQAGSDDGMPGGWTYHHEESGDSLEHGPSPSSTRQVTGDLRASPAIHQQRTLQVRRKKVDEETMVMGEHPAREKLLDWQEVDDFLINV